MSEQRKQLIVKKKFQYSLVMETVLTMFIMINILVIAAYFIINSVADLQTVKQNLIYAVVSSEILAVFVVFQLNIKESHRIAGPLTVLESNLRKVKQGDLCPTMVLRQKDHFHEVKDIFNQTIGDMREKITTIKVIANKAKEALPDSADSEAIDQLLQELAYFKVEAEKTAEPSTKK